MLDDLIRIANTVINQKGVFEPNATIVFTTISAPTQVTYDDVGNPVITATETQVTLSCWLRQAQRPVIDTQKGTNIDGEYFEGQLLDPKIYALPIKAKGDIVATVNGRRGLFYPAIFPDSPASADWAIDEVMGQKIAGYIQFFEGD